MSQHWSLGKARVLWEGPWLCVPGWSWLVRAPLADSKSLHVRTTQQHPPRTLEIRGRKWLICKHAHMLSDTHTHTGSHTLRHTHMLTCTQTHSLTHTQTHTLRHMLTLRHRLTCFQIHTLTQAHRRSDTLIHTCTQTHIHTHSHRLTHTDTLTRAHTTGKLEEPCAGRTPTRDHHLSVGGLGPLHPSLQEGHTWDGFQGLKCPWLLGS